MGRPKKSAVASRGNGSTAAKKMTKKRVEVLTFAHGDGNSLALANVTKFTFTYRPPTQKGSMYSDEVLAVAHCMANQKRVRFANDATPQKEKETAWCNDRQQLEAMEQKAYKLLATLIKDPKRKAAKLRAMVKSAGFSLEV